MGGLPLIAVLLIVAVFACVFHNILPAGAAVASLITIRHLVAGMGGNVTAAIFLCAVFSCAAFLLPLDLCVYCAYSARKCFTPVRRDERSGGSPASWPWRWSPW